MSSFNIRTAGFDRWHVTTAFGDRLTLVRASAATRDERKNALDGRAAQSALHGLVRGIGLRHVRVPLADVCRRLGIASIDRRSSEDLLATAAREIEAGALLLTRALTKGERPHQPDLVAPENPLAALAPKTKTAWLEVSVRDDNGRPYQTALTVLFPDGGSRRLVTDEHGFVRCEDIPEGTCQVMIDGLDGSSVTRG